MNRIILLHIDDAWIKRFGETAGASGSANAVTLRMTFDQAWDGTGKTAYFTDALGQTSVKVVLGLAMLVDGMEDTYDVPVPGEAMSYPGLATVTLVGVSEGRVITTQAAKFRVLDAQVPDSAGNSQPITPDEFDQLQEQMGQLEEIFVTNRQQAQQAAQQASQSAQAADASAQAAAGSADTAQSAAADASSAAQAAQEHKADAADSAAKAEHAATQAGTHAQDAQESAQLAQDNAQSAEDAAGSAQNSAAAARESQTQAEKSAQAADASAKAAAQSAASIQGSQQAAADSAQTAQDAARQAEQSMDGASNMATLAQSWAVGGTNTRPGEDADNAKYWAQQAQSAAGGGVTSFNGRGGMVMPQAGDYTAAMVGAASLGDNGQISYSHVPHLTSNVTLYVDAATGDDTNPGTQSEPFKTIQAAISSVPDDLYNFDATINVADGTYSGNVSIRNKHGGGVNTGITITGTSSVIVSGTIYIGTCSCPVYITGITINGPVGAYYSDHTILSSVTINASSFGVDSVYGSVSIFNCTINNATTAAVRVCGGTAYVNGLSGNGNTIGVSAGNDNSGIPGLAIIGINRLSATTAYVKYRGGAIIQNGAIV